MDIISTYVLLGVCAGLLAGLLGVGGGQVVAPGLLYVFSAQTIPHELIMHLALGTSLATILLTSISSVYAHHRLGAVQWDVFWRLAPGIVVGALLGGWLAHWLRGDVLQYLFGGFLLLLAAQMGFALKPKAERDLPALPGMLATGGVIGGVSAIVGVGGGSMVVPFLSWCNVSMRHAIATAAACGVPVAIGGAVGFIVSGWHAEGLPSWSTGFVYWPACIAIAAASLITAILGAKLAHKLPTALLKRVFALFLAIAAIRILTL